jgi:hypothetical protein
MIEIELVLATKILDRADRVSQSHSQIKIFIGCKIKYY